MFERIQELEKQVRFHNMRYWVMNDQVISDSEYDKITRELQSLSPNNPVLFELHSPSMINDEGDVVHSEKMFSQHKVYDVPGLIKWASKLARNDREVYSLSPKYDGCSVELNNGILATSGDGVIGKNASSSIPITQIWQNSTNIPASQFKGRCRGEAVVLKNVFNECRNTILKKDGTKYKTERQMSAGLLARSDIDSSWGEVLTVIDFDNYCVLLTLEEMKVFDWDSFIAETKEAPFTTDGIVIKVYDHKYHEELGTDRHRFKSEIAFKYANPQATTKNKDVIWSVGKESISPKAVLEPVMLSGVTVQHANLHNFKSIQKKGIKIGSTVIIERGGDAVPDIVSVVQDGCGTDIELPLFCPACNHRTSYQEPTLYCINEHCPGKLEVKLMDSVIRFGIDGLGRPTLKKMIETLNVKNMIDIINLTKERIMEMDGFTDGSSTDNLYNDIQKVVKKGITEDQMLSSLNLTDIGTSLSEKLLSDRSLHELKNMSIDEMIEIPNIGKERAKVISEGLEANWDYLNELTNNIGVIEKSKGGLKICMTGSFPEKKSYYQKLMKESGFASSGSVSKDVSYVVCDNPKNSNKEKRAEQLGIPIINSEKLIEILGGVNENS